MSETDGAGAATGRPLTLSTHRGVRLLTLCALYVAQGVPFGFVVITLKAILAGRGLDTSQLGWLLGTSMLPWSFKWAWGPLIDRFGLPAMGRRRPWILLAQGLMALTMAAIIGMDDLLGDVRLLGALLFVHNCFASLQDVAVDALAVDLLDEAERGRANGLMYGSKYFGTVIGGTGLATVAEFAGLQAALAVQVAVLGLIFVLPLMVRERAGERLWPWSPGRAAPHTVANAPDSVRALFRQLFMAFGLRSTLAGALLALLALMGTGVLAPVSAVLFTQHLGWAPERLAQIEGTAYVVGLCGAVLGGFLVDRFGARAMIAFGLLGLSTTWVVFAALQPLWQVRAVPTTVLYIEPVFQSLASVGMFALFMGISWPKVAATQFTAYMALLNLSSSMGNLMSGTLDGWLDFAGLYLVGAALMALAASVLLLIDPEQTRSLLAARAAALRDKTGNPG